MQRREVRPASPGMSLQQFAAMREAIILNREQIEREKAEALEAVQEQIATKATDYAEEQRLAAVKLRSLEQEIEETKNSIRAQRSEIKNLRSKAEVFKEEIKPLEDELKIVQGAFDDPEEARQAYVESLKQKEKPTQEDSQIINNKGPKRRDFIERRKNKIASKIAGENGKIRELETQAAELDETLKATIAKLKKLEAEAVETNNKRNLYGKVFYAQKELRRSRAFKPDADVEKELRRERDDREKVARLKDRLERMQAKSAVSVVDNCPNPHQSTYDHTMENPCTTSRIERGELARQLVKELHSYVNDARLSPTMRKILDIEELPSDSEMLWMLGTLVCWDTEKEEIRILMACSGNKIISNNPNRWCPFIENFSDFSGQTITKKKMQKACLKKLRVDADRVGQLGNCAAPKMLGRAAATQGKLIPLEMAEAGFEPGTSNHGKLIESCRFCKFSLGFWLHGLEEAQGAVKRDADPAVEKALQELSGEK